MFHMIFPKVSRSIISPLSAAHHRDLPLPTCTKLSCSPQGAEHGVLQPPSAEMPVRSLANAMIFGHPNLQGWESCPCLGILGRHLWVNQPYGLRYSETFYL